MRIDIKPLSVNCAFKGKRFKTKEYDVFIKSMLYLLPNTLKIDSKAYLKLFITFGYSSRASDIDNALKTFIDCLVKKYGFDDRNIYELEVKKEITPKGKEFIDFEIKEFEKLNKEKLKIELIDWTYNCGDGCCTNYGTTTKVNGKEMPLQNQDVATILEMVLKHLGYDVEIEESYEHD